MTEAELKVLRFQVVRVQHGVDQDFWLGRAELVPPPPRSNLEPLAGARKFSTTSHPLSSVGASVNEDLE